MKCIVVNKTKIIITNIIVYFCIFTLLSNSQTSIDSISTSTNIFITKLLPSLFPYILITELVINFGIIDNMSYGFSTIICRLFKIPTSCASTIVISYLLGYPNAAKHINKLYKQGTIDKTICRKLIAFTNNANPSYIICAIGITMLNNIKLGIALAVSHFLSSILIGISLSSNKNIIQQNITKSNTFKQISSAFELLVISLLNTAKTMIIIFGYTVIFSLIPTLIFNKLNLPQHIYGLVIGVFELSNGINILASSNIDFTLMLCLISFVLSFSSFMVIMQIYSFVYTTGVKFKELVKYKLLHGFISSAITYLLLKLPVFNKLVTVFASKDNYTYNSVLPPIVYILIAIFTYILLILTLKKKR